MNKKMIKAVVLEHWFGVDKIIFGNNLPKDVLKESDYNLYTSTKGCLLSNLFELYNKIGYEPSIPQFKTASDLVESATLKAIEAKKSAKTVLSKSDVAQVIREEIQEYIKGENITEELASKYIINKKYRSSAIDSMMLENAFSNSCRACISSWEASVLIDAHKNLRESLIEISERIELNEGAKEWGKAAAINTAAGATGGAVGGAIGGYGGVKARTKNAGKGAVFGAVVGAAATPLAVGISRLRLKENEKKCRNTYKDDKMKMNKCLKLLRAQAAKKHTDE